MTPRTDDVRWRRHEKSSGNDAGTTHQRPGPRRVTSTQSAHKADPRRQRLWRGCSLSLRGEREKLCQMGNAKMKNRGIRESSHPRRAKRLARKFRKEQRRRKEWINGRAKSNRRFRSSFVIMPDLGIPCPRCARPTQIREHREITERHRQQPYYFRRWFRCMHRDCPTRLVMVDEFKVWNENSGR